jgi:EmrB/QacA subfamily drug resistance transporter
MRRTVKARLALLAFASLITSLDFTIVYVALPDIARDVGFTPHSLQWVVSGYTVVFGGFLLLGGRLSDLLGRRRMFALGMILYGVGSLLGGLAPTPALLVAARMIQGLGGAVLVPSTLALVNTMFEPGPARTRALTLWAAGGAAGLSLGSLLGGVLTGALGWEWVFFVNVPLAAAGLALAPYLLTPDDLRTRARLRDLDGPGALTGTAGATLLVLTLAMGPESGWLSVPVLVAGALAVGSLAAFLVIERRGADPLMPLRLFANRSLRGAALVILLFGLSLQGVPYLLTVFFQTVAELSPLQTGLAFLGPTLTITAGNVLSERLIARFGTRRTLVLGLLTGAAGSAVLAPGLSGTPAQSSGEVSVLATTLVIAGIVVAGLGMGLIFPAMFNAVGTGVAPAEQGSASGIANTALQVGSGAGLAVLVAVANTGTGGLAGEALRVAVGGGLESAAYLAALIAVVGAVAAIRLPREDPGATYPPPDLAARGRADA